jgi:protease II
MKKTRLWIAFLTGLAASAVSAQTQPYSGLGAESLPPEVVAKYAPLPIAPEVSRAIQAMLDVREPGLGILSPDGGRLYFNWSVTGSRQVWRLDGPKAFPIQLTGGEDRTSILEVTPDGRWLLLSRDVGGQENPGLYVQASDGGPLRTIQRVERARTFLIAALADSRTILFRSNDVRPDSYAIYRYDLQTGERTLLFGEPGLWAVADYQGDARDLRLLLSRSTGALADELYELDAASKTLTPLLGAGEKTEYAASYAAQLGELLVQTNRFGEFRRLYRWKMGADATEKSFTAVSPDRKMDVDGFTIDEARQHVYLEWNDGGYSRLQVLDARNLATEALPLPAAEQVSVGSASRDGRYVTLGIESGVAPGTSYVWDWTTKTLTQWVVPSAPEVDLAAFVPARLMSYAARDGTPIPMFVRFPKGCDPAENKSADPCPVVVDFHGGPEGQARPGFSPSAQMFVEAGFVYVEPNVRGSDGYGKTWLQADDTVKRLDVITDIDDCGKWIRAKWGRNGKAPKVGITGGSYGGYSTLIGMTMFAGTYDAGASVVGIGNLMTFLRNTSPYRRILRMSEYGDPDKDAEVLRRLSPVTYVDRVKSPLLLIQGLNDPRVPAGEAVALHDVLEEKGIPSRLILIPDEGHGSAKRGNQVIEIGSILLFFDEHLKGRTPAGRAGTR